MKSKKIRILVYVMAVLPLIVFLMMYRKLPVEMPAHWNLDGTVRYDSKNTFFLFTAMPVVLSVMLDFLPKIDPRKNNYTKFGRYYDFFCLFMMIFLDGMTAVILIESLRPGTLSVDKYVMVMVAFLFLVIGNMLPTVKSNFYVGIKTPWSLSDNEVWNKSNRLGGHLMFGAGVVLLIGTFVLPPYMMFWMLMVLVVIITVVPMLMSYIWYTQRHKS